MNYYARSAKEDLNVNELARMLGIMDDISDVKITELISRGIIFQSLI